MKKRLLVAALVAAFATHAACAAADLAAAGTPTLKGEVLEVIDVEAYTYLRLKTVDGEVWAAVGKSPVKKGTQVTIHDAAVMENFESKALKRTFPVIVFGTVGVATAAIAAAAPANAPAAPASTAGAPAKPTASPHGAADLGGIHGGIAKSADVGPVKVAKAEGPAGRTVAEVNANRTTLKDKTVTIRAKVVKVNANVMGKNWVHLRDGSGAAADQSNDLLVTSKEEPKVGDVVVAKGVVRTNVDLGSGYAFKVLVENASFQK
jgi:hypothetical protein